MTAMLVSSEKHPIRVSNCYKNVKQNVKVYSDRTLWSHYSSSGEITPEQIEKIQPIGYQEKMAV